MRAISIRQPWASLTAAGIRDIDLSNRDTNYRGRVLIHASSRRIGRDFGIDIPVDWFCRLRNAQMMGLVPYDEEVPVSAVIGMAELIDCTTEIQDSPWSAAGHNWVLRDMLLFDQPILGAKGKQGLFDLPEINEANLPSFHQPLQPSSSYHDSTFCLTMTENEIERQIAGWPLAIMICDDGIASPLLTKKKEGYSLREINQLSLSSGNGETFFEITRAEILAEEIAGHTIQYIALHISK